MIRKRLIPVLVPAGLLVASLAPAQSRPVAAIDSNLLRGTTFFLAHDLLEGRATGRRGHDVAALYVATQAEALGLRPAGDNGSYFQAVPLVEAEIVPSGTRLDVTLLDSSGSARTSFTYGSGFIPNVGTARTLIDFSGSAVYVGSPRDVLAHPEALPPLRGSVVLLAGVFGSDAAAADTLRDRGAVGVVHLLPDAQLYRLYVNSRGPSRLYVEDTTVVSSFVPRLPAVIASPELMRALMPRVAASGSPERPVALPNVLIDVHIALAPHRLRSRNVVAVLPGGDRARRDEYVVYTAHLDHLGIGARDANGDSIFNGFSDNAAGSAMLLAIAKAMIAGPRPPRSVLFLWLTGEEVGLLGSDYFVAHPTIPIDRVVGDINLDAGAPPARSIDWRVSGGSRSTLGSLAIDIAQRAGWTAQATPASPNTDYFPFLRIGIPAVFLIPGPGHYEDLTPEQSQALRARWDHYHNQADNWAPDFPFSGLVRYADYGLRIGMALGPLSRPRMFNGR